ncbi:hypothetical protein HY407_05140 [Candidatus Gottesmanbacteria bacterium]|nr:hypothetical protein [Candidatus Gottesmanbacteria bacterium]
MQNIPQNREPQVKQVLDGSREILIALPRNPNVDSVASGLSLYLALSASGKRVNIVSPSPMLVEFNQLVGVDKIGNNLANGGRNLIVSFPYQEGSIEKVSYNIENSTFNLVIEPREGYPNITPDKLSYSFGGGSFDLVIVIDAENLNDLGEIYSQNQNLFTEKQVINIDNSLTNSRFGKINLVDPNLATISEMVTNLLSSWGLRMDPDIATNLLAGITMGSNNFTSPTSTVATFESAAICMRNGARKMSVQSMPAPTQQQQPYQFPTNYAQPQASYQPTQSPQATQNYVQSQRSMNQPRPQQPIQQRTPMMQQQPRPVQQPPRQPVQQPIQQQPTQQPKKQEAPADWLKPKIYKGSTLL